MLYICDPFFIFSLIFSVIKTDTVIFCAFLEYFLFWVIIINMQIIITNQIAKFQPRVVAQLLLDILQISA